MKTICSEFIYNEPAPTPECHASTILKQRDGTLIAAWFGGTREGADDVAIWCSVRKDGVWSVPKKVSTEPDVPHWNPVLFAIEDDVWLFYKTGKQIPYWETQVVVSKDGGVSWSKPCAVVEGDTSGGRGPVKNKPLRLSNGRILAPASTEQGVWRPFVDVYENGAWTKKWMPVVGENAERINLIQPTLWEYPEGHVHALMRTNQGYIYRSDSTDYGETWVPVYPTDMPNNNSGLDCVRAADGRLYLVCNPIGSDWGLRSPLTLYTSSDNGASFEKVLDLETEQGEYSYPAIVSAENRLYITYTWKRQKVAFRELELE